jgi:hypothetical protein
MQEVVADSTEAYIASLSAGQDRPGREQLAARLRTVRGQPPFRTLLFEAGRYGIWNLVGAYDDYYRTRGAEPGWSGRENRGARARGRSKRGSPRSTT